MCRATIRREGQCWQRNAGASDLGSPHLRDVSADLRAEVDKDMNKTAHFASPQEIGLAALVDDEKIDRMIYQRVIDRSGVVRRTVSFSHALEALEFLREEGRPEVDVLFLDINMPKMNGFEFLETATKEFGEDFAKMVIVMLTTSINPKDHARAKSFSVVRKFLYKPLTSEDVLDVARLVAEHQ